MAACSWRSASGSGPPVGTGRSGSRLNLLCRRSCAARSATRRTARTRSTSFPSYDHRRVDRLPLVGELRERFLCGLDDRPGVDRFELRADPLLVLLAHVAQTVADPGIVALCPALQLRRRDQGPQTDLTASDANTALVALDAFAQKYGQLLPPVVKAWREAWEYVTPFVAYPADVRRA